MVKVGIYGAGSRRAGELIRVLLYHPDVLLRAAVDPACAGRSLSSVHHGLIGENSIDFSAELDVSGLDVLFVLANPEDALNVVPSPADAPDLCVIDLTAHFRDARIADPLVVYGVPELNRKALVRGAKRVVVPSALESMATVALLPLVMKSMLPDTLPLRVEAEAAIIDSMPRDLQVMVEEMVAVGGKRFVIVPEFVADDSLGRVMRISCDINLPVPIDNITDMYETLYDDHNLTHIVGEEPDPCEAEGTDKCIVSLDKSDEGRLELRTIADAHLRGGAGDAVHVMNLLMGLYEKTGLTLKASRF